MTTGFAGPPLGGGGPFAPIIADTDPGAVGAGRLWLTAAGILSMRNAANDGWLTLSAAATPDLATVLAAGNTTGGRTVKGAAAGGGLGAYLDTGDASAGDGGNGNLVGGTGAAGKAGGAAAITGGPGDAGVVNPAEFRAHGGDGLGGPGKVEILTAGSAGSAGDLLTSDGTYATWAPPVPPPLSMATVVITAPQAVNTAAEAAITFDGVEYDPDGYWSAGAPTRLTAPVGGLYLLTVSVALSANPAEAYILPKVGVASMTRMYANIDSGFIAGYTIHASEVVGLNAGDYVQLFGLAVNACNLVVGGDPLVSLIRLVTITPA